MKALLLKEFLVLWRQSNLILLSLFIFFVNFFSLMMDIRIFLHTAAFLYFLPVGFLSMDRKANWDELVATMPCSVRDIVLSKYLFVLFSVPAILFFTLVPYGLLCLLSPENPPPFFIREPAPPFAILVGCFLLTMMLLPFLFYLNRADALFAGIASLLAVLLFFPHAASYVDFLLFFNLPALYELLTAPLISGALSLLVCGLAFFLSLRLSIRLYPRRQW